MNSKTIMGDKLQPFVWSTDRDNSYESFMECYLYWIKAKDEDGTFDPYKMFKEDPK